jgi:hypothetical protein
MEKNLLLDDLHKRLGQLTIQKEIIENQYLATKKQVVELMNQINQKNYQKRLDDEKRNNKTAKGKKDATNTTKK